MEMFRESSFQGRLLYESARIFRCEFSEMMPYFSEKASENTGRYYGWVIVGLTFFTMAIGGSIVGTFPVFYVALGGPGRTLPWHFLFQWPRLRFPPALLGRWWTVGDRG